MTTSTRSKLDTEYSKAVSEAESYLSTASDFYLDDDTDKDDAIEQVSDARTALSDAIDSITNAQATLDAIEELIEGENEEDE